MTSSAAIEKQYKIKSTLGEGAFGTVCLAVRNRDQKEVSKHCNRRTEARACFAKSSRHSNALGIDNKQRFLLMIHHSRCFFSRILITQFAIKKTKEPVKDWRLEREVMATRQIGVHPNIVKALEVHYDTKLQSVNIVFEYMNAGCLHQLIESHLVKKQFVEEHFIQSIMYQMLEGIEHCHRSGWMHR